MQKLVADPTARVPSVCTSPSFFSLPYVSAPHYYHHPPPQYYQSNHPERHHPPPLITPQQPPRYYPRQPTQQQRVHDEYYHQSRSLGGNPTHTRPYTLTHPNTHPHTNVMIMLMMNNLYIIVGRTLKYLKKIILHICCCCV